MSIIFKVLDFFFGEYKTYDVKNVFTERNDNDTVITKIIIEKNG